MADDRVFYFAGIVPLGAYCYEVVTRRCRLRGQGAEACLVRGSDSGLIFSVSSRSLKVCPDPQRHCLSCIYLQERQCPLERAFVAKVDYARCGHVF